MINGFLAQICSTDKVTEKKIENAREFASVPGNVQFIKDDPNELVAFVRQGKLEHYPKLIINGSVTGQCTCGAYFKNVNEGRGAHCQHTLAMCILKDGGKIDLSPDAIAEMSKPRQRKPRQARQSRQSKPKNGPRVISLNSSQNTAKVNRFKDRVNKGIASAVSEMSDVVLDYFQEYNEQVLFLIGGTGLGKTSAISSAAVRMGWEFISYAGTEDSTMSNVWGIEIPGQTSSLKPLHLAFELARQGKHVVFFLDEFLRLPKQFQDGFMTVLLPRNAATVRSQIKATQASVSAFKAPPIPDDFHGEVFAGEGDFWPMQWAPVEFLHFAIAANGWGTRIDPAFASRCRPMQCDYNQAVLKPFSENFRSMVELSWQMNREGTVSLPIDYRALRNAKSADDGRVFDEYLQRLQIIDVSEYEIMLEHMRIYKETV